MGLMDKYKALFTGPAIDVPAEIGKLLPPGDRVLTHAQVIPSAYKRGGGGGISATNRLMNKATSMAETAISSARHIGGDDAAIARRLPQDSGPYVLVISEHALSLWDLGLTGNQLPAEQLVTVPRTEISSLADTGKKAQGGVPVARLTFTDASFFDYRLISKPGPDFWSVVNSL